MIKGKWEKEKGKGIRDKGMFLFHGFTRIKFEGLGYE